MAKKNPQRGEVLIDGPEDKQYRLCLTLGAIAQIEEELGVESLTLIDEVMKKARMKDVITIFIALLNGGGEDVTRKDMMRWEIPLLTLMEKIRETFAAAGFKDDAEDGEANSGN